MDIGNTLQLPENQHIQISLYIVSMVLYLSFVFLQEKINESVNFAKAIIAISSVLTVLYKVKLLDNPKIALLVSEISFLILLGVYLSVHSVCASLLYASGYKIITTFR